MKKNFLYNFLLTVSNLLFPLITFPYVSRILGADGLGLVNFIVSYSENYCIIAALGIPIYGLREIAKLGGDRVRRSKLFFEILSIHILFTIILFLIYVATVFINPQLKQYTSLSLLGGLTILFNVFSIQWFFAGISQFKYITVRSLIIRILSIVFIFALVKQKEDFGIYLVIYVITILITALIDLYSARRYLFFRGGTSLSLNGILSHSKAIFLLGIYTVLTSIYTVLPTTLLGFLNTKASVGYYFAANKIIRMVVSVFSALITVMIPKLNLTLEEKNSLEYAMLIDKGLRIIITFGIPLTLFTYLMAEPIMLILGGKNFYNSIPVIRIMSPIIFFVSVAQIFVYLILSAYRKDKELIGLAVIGMITSLTINIIFIPKFAEIATGYSQLISEIVVTIIAFALSHKIANFRFPVKIFLLNVLCAAPFILLAYWALLLPNALLSLGTAAITCALLFFFYQFFIIKDQVFLNIVRSTMKFRRKALPVTAESDMQLL
ncbi:MAG: flippase [Chitinophagaceae bacterium]|nr:flippase [Chitinophagaceae bacterium]